MDEADSKSSKVGIRELRQNLSVYLRRVREGEALEVTDRGESVALLIPLPPAAGPLETLISSGRASAPEGDVLDLGLPPGPERSELTEALEESRSERL